MAASKYDFTIEQGTSFKFSLIYKDSNNNPIDLTDWCARLIFRTNTNQTRTFLTTNTDYIDYKFIIDGPAGKITLMIPATMTNTFNFKLANYDLELQSPDELYEGGGNYTIRLLYGQIRVLPRNSSSNSSLDCNT